MLVEVSWIGIAVFGSMCGALVSAFTLGFEGPRHHHRYGPLTWPDAIWTIPASGMLIYLAIRNPPLTLEWTPFVALSMFSNVLALVTSACWFASTRWICKLPRHFQVMVDAGLHAFLVRQCVRCGAWQGVMLLAMQFMPGDRWRWFVILPCAAFLLSLGHKGWRAAYVVQRRWRCAHTPFDKADGPFDIFISYKSEDANVVRQVVDRLLALGLRVWFAEYMILFHARDRFQEAIDTAIRSSQLGVLFTNDRYLASPYCCNELEQLLANVKVRAIEVRIPSEPGVRRRYGEALRDVPHLECKNDVHDAREIVAFIQRHVVGHAAMIAPSFADAAPAQQFMIQSRLLDISIDCAGWIVDWSKSRMGSEFEASWLSASRRFAQDSADVRVVVAETKGYHRLSQWLGRTNDDRAIYKRLCQEAMLSVCSAGGECRGVHLFNRDGFGHLMITYFAAGRWAREYTIVVPHALGAKDVLCLVTFSFTGNFLAFCGAAQEMDRLVSQIRILDGRRGVVVRDGDAVHE